MSVILYYTFCFYASLVLTCVYIYLWHRHFNVNFSLLFALIPIVNLGYYILGHAKTPEGAIIATKITYIGGCFLILFITFYIFDMCRISLPKWMILGMVIISMAIYGFVLTIGEGTLFYKEVTATLENGRMVLHKVYGPVHTACYVFVLLYFMMSFGAIIYCLFRKNQVSRRIIWYLFIPEIASVICFFGGRQIVQDVDTLPAAYVFAQLMYLFIAHYICAYNIEDTAIDSLMEEGVTGFISFDFNMNYLGSNQAARKVFPGVEKLTVDRSLKKDPVLWDLFTPWIGEFKEDETRDKHHCTGNGRIYLVDINYLYHNDRKNGFQLVITDDTKNQEYIRLIDSYNADLEREVQEKTADIVRMHNNLIMSMATMVESRDNSTGGHIVRTSDVVKILADEIRSDEDFVRENGVTEEFLQDLIKAAPLHDLGKIAVDDAILRKPGRFTPEEFEKMKAHAPEGAKVLHSILEGTDDTKFKVIAENVAHYHHERMDGSGYPDGLRADEIPLEARIMAIADVYDALVSKRVYKERMPFDKADSIMMESMGKHFDVRLEKFYVAARPKMEQYYMEKDRD